MVKKVTFHTHVTIVLHTNVCKKAKMQTTKSFFELGSRIYLYSLLKKVRTWFKKN